MQVPRTCAAAGAFRDCVGFVDQQQRASGATCALNGVEETWLRKHDADVGHRGLHDEDRDIAVR